MGTCVVRQNLKQEEINQILSNPSIPLPINTIPQEQQIFSKLITQQSINLHFHKTSPQQNVDTLHKSLISYKQLKPIIAILRRIRFFQQSKFELPYLSWIRIDRVNAELYIQEICGSESDLIQHNSQAIETIIQQSGKSIINSLIPIISNKSCIYLYIPINSQLFIIKEGEENLIQGNHVQQNGYSFINLNDGEILNNTHLWELKGNYICELICINDIDFQIGFQNILEDFKAGMVLLSYNALHEHIKRRLLKQYHLWVIFIKLKENQNKALIACSILTNYLYKQDSLTNDLELTLFNIINGSSHLIYAFDRIKSIYDLDLSVQEEEMLLSDQLVKEILIISLNNSQMLFRCIEQKFNIKTIKFMDSHHLLSLEYRNDYRFIQSKNEIIVNHLIKPDLIPYSEKQESSLEIFLHSEYYDQNNRKYFIPSLNKLSNLKDQNPYISNQIKIILMIIESCYNLKQQLEIQFQTEYLDNKQQLLIELIQSYSREINSSNCNYEQTLLLVRNLLHQNLQYPIEPFCLHRQSVQASIKGDQKKMKQLILEYSNFDTTLPCNNITVHSNYLHKPAQQVIKASIQGFLMQEWLMWRFNELLMENLQINQNELPDQQQPGEIYMWGSNQHYQIAQPCQINYDIPKKVNQSIIFTHLHCGHNHTLSISLYQEVYCWGNNEYGKCGIFNQKSVKHPTKLLNSKNAIQINSGHDHSVYLDKNGNLFTWGCGEGGMLGINTFQNEYLSQQVGLNNVQQVQCGGLHTAVISEGQVYTWGRGDGGQLGGDFLEIGLPYLVELQDKIVQIGCGDAHTVALSAEGIVYGWGYNEQGQLGVDDMISVKQPMQIEKNVDRIYCGSLQTYFLKGNQLFGIGSNDFRQLGQEGVIIEGDIEDVSVGQDHTFCLMHSVYGWGLDKLINEGEGVKEIVKFKCQSIGCGGYHSGVITRGTEKYVKFESEYDYTIKY